jgi:hypothetical protein
MTHYQRKSDLNKASKVMVRNEPYLIINIFLAGVILLVLAYSGFFSPDQNNYPVVCLHEKLTGEPCVSCGLSHSFSLIVRGRIDEAYRWNTYGMRVFIFFISQLILRVAFSIYYIKNTATRNQLILADCIGSGLFFMIAFWPFLARLFSGWQ